MLFSIQDVKKVEFEDMNLVHVEELEMVNEIYDYLISENPDLKKIENYLEEFVFHLRDHFLFEEEMMRETNCPILSCHESEHTRVQKIMFQVFSEFAKTKNINLLKYYFECEFKTWIENHIVTMDTVTGAYLNDPTKFQQVESHSCS